MKLVTYDAGAGPRVGVLEFDGVVDAGWDGDMVAFIAAGAPVSRGDHVRGARLLAPLRPRSLRDFLAFEGHLKNAYRNLGREIPDEWYEIPAYYKGLPDTVVGPDTEVNCPAYSDEPGSAGACWTSENRDMGFRLSSVSHVIADDTPPGGRPGSGR